MLLSIVEKIIKMQEIMVIIKWWRFWNDAERRKEILDEIHLGYIPENNITMHNSAGEMNNNYIVKFRILHEAI